MVDLVLIGALQRQLIGALRIVAADGDGRRILEKRLNARHGQNLGLQFLDDLVDGERALGAGLQHREDVGLVARRDEGKDARARWDRALQYVFTAQT